jgi:hypothetical protein
LATEKKSFFDDLVKKSCMETRLKEHGLSLEIRTKRALRTAGYNAVRTYFEDFDEKRGLSVRRELDFLTNPKMIHTIKCSNGFEIRFIMILFGDCKHSNTHDFFAFEADQEERKYLSIYDFPLRFYSEPLPPRNQMMGSFARYYGFQFVAERIVEAYTERILHAKAERSDSPEQLFGDDLTNGACDSLVAASKYFEKVHTVAYDMIREDAFEELSPSYNTVAADMQKEQPASIMQEFMRKQDKEVVEVFPFVNCAFGVPLLVVDDNRDFVETVVAEDGSVTCTKRAEVALYPYVSWRISQANGVEPPLFVVVCSYSHLKQAIKILEEGTRKMAMSYSERVRDHPETVLAEIFLPEASNRPQKPFVISKR